MYCPYCSSKNTQVKETRILETNEVKRRRSCSVCKQRFITVEKLIIKEITVEKKNGKKVSFDIDKVRESVRRSLTDLQEIDKIEYIVDSIDRKLQLQPKNTVPSTDIATMIMDSLLLINEVAYIRYASVYYEFKNKADFINLLNKLK